METIKWRYHPEFMVEIMIDNQPAGEVLELVPSPGSAAIMENYGLLTRSVPRGLVGYVKQRYNGTDWVPEVSIAAPCVFAFWLTIRQGPAEEQLSFFSQSAQVLGRQIFYANNLSASGAIDANLEDGTVVLTEMSTVSASERASLSNCILST